MNQEPENTCGTCSEEKMRHPITIEMLQTRIDMHKTEREETMENIACHASAIAFLYDLVRKKDESVKELSSAIKILKNQ